jgi:hypothetical protein
MNEEIPSVPTWSDVFVENWLKYLKMVLFEYHQQVQSFIWLTGSVLFILSLKRGFISYQLRRLAWSLIVLIFIFVFSFV